ncbi:MAG TPA: AAA family ATPase, partial [Thermoanaerobaculia bacterium]
MPRRFNTAGPCDPVKHYMLPPERRLPGVRDLIDQEHYFVIHAPRQVGKTTCFHALARSLTAEGRYAALLTSCEAGQLLSPKLDESLGALLETLRQDAEEDLPPELRPPAADRSLVATIQLRNLLVRWSRQCPRPVVLFLDEIDTLTDEALLSVLRQLRSGYRARPRGFPQALALIGLRDVRDYRMEVRPEGRSLGTASPFNIKVESLTLRNFTAVEVSELYDQHTAETGQEFSPEAKDLAFELSGGHPWLVNALAREAVERLVPDPARPVTAASITAAKEALITRRDTHLDSLIDRLREPRVQRVIEPILAGELLPAEVLDDDIQLVQDLGLVISGPHGLQIANPIYREVIPRALTSVLQQSIQTPAGSSVDAEGRLR